MTGCGTTSMYMTAYINMIKKNRTKSRKTEIHPDRMGSGI